MFLQPKLSLKVSQRQVLTPGLVQMVSVLALNKLELKDMINSEMIENPVLEELDESAASLDERSGIEGDRERSVEDLAAEKAREEKDPFDEIDFGSYFQDYLDPGFKTSSSNFEEFDKPSFEHFLSQPSTLTDHLIWQLGSLTLSHEVRAAAELIIGNLDENGYLTATDEEMAQALAAALKAAELPEPIPFERPVKSASADGEARFEASLRAVVQARELMHQLDPLGVGARDLRECLLIQIGAQRREAALADDAPSRSSGRAGGGRRPRGARPRCLRDRGQHRLQSPRAAAEKGHARADEECRPNLRRRAGGGRLHPHARSAARPALQHLGDPADRAGCGVCEARRRVCRRDERGGYADAAAEPATAEMLREKNTEKDVREYVKERYKCAIQLLRNIEQRKNTIVRTCEVIVRRQAEFLERGEQSLKPMMIKEVAEEIGVHPSTVSRAVANKYVHTAQGVYELRFFFSEGVNGPEGGDLPLVLLKRKVKKLIEEEDPRKPLTDDHLAAELKAQGIKVTRRTVAKYREDMQIPSTHQRRVR